jgi:mannose-6-phosphate isomerase-like protein (cupin superfamily)
MIETSFFPDIITRLPEAEVFMPGVRAHLAQAGDQQFFFMVCEKDFASPEHEHEAQWGIVLDGEFELVMDGKRHTFKKGDSYFIPQGVKHTALIKQGYKGLMFIDKKDRYHARPITKTH